MSVLVGLTLLGCVGDSAVQSPLPGADGGVDAANDAVNDTLGEGAPSCVDLKTDPKNCGTCGHDCVGGACTAGSCQPTTLATGQNAIMKLVPTAAKLYWARSKTNTQTGGIYVADLDGQNATPLYDAGATAYCTGLAVTSTAAYFDCANELFRCALPSCSSNPTPLLAVAGVGDVAFDATNDRLYFTIGTPYNAQTGGYVASVPSTGGASTRLTIADQPGPGVLTIDSGFVYWLDSGTYLSDNPQNNGGARKAPFGTNQPVTVVAADPTGTDWAALALQGGTVYWSGFSGSTGQIRSAPTVGGSPSTYTATVTKSPARTVVADASYVYWSEDQTGIYRCEKNCTKPTLIATSATTLALAQDTASIYWANSVGEIRRLAK